MGPVSGETHENEPETPRNHHRSGRRLDAPASCRVGRVRPHSTRHHPAQPAERLVRGSGAMSRMRGIVEQPEGLRYLPDFLSVAEERSLLERLRSLDYEEVRMHGQVARRVVRHFGFGYAFDSARLTPGDPVPVWLLGVRERCARLLIRAPEDLAEVLATRYPPGATIGWHRDAPAFGDVVGVSLAAPCVMRIQYGSDSGRRVFEK